MPNFPKSCSVRRNVEFLLRVHDFLGAPFATFGRRVLVARARLSGGTVRDFWPSSSRCACTTFWGGIFDSPTSRVCPPKSRARAIRTRRPKVANGAPEKSCARSKNSTFRRTEHDFGRLGTFLSARLSKVAFGPTKRRVLIARARLFGGTVRDFWPSSSYRACTTFWGGLSRDVGGSKMAPQKVVHAQ